MCPKARCVRRSSPHDPPSVHDDHGPLATPWSRRRLLSAAALAALPGAPRRASAADPPQVPADVDPGSLLTRLVHRLTMGLSPDELALAHALGYEGYLDYHLNPDAIDDSAFESMPMFAAITSLNLAPDELLAMDGLQLSFDMMDAVTLRAIYSKRQLFERIVEFWTDHFSIDIDRGVCRNLKTVDDRDVIRAAALLTFEDLLIASASSPCMLHYLDNDTSTGTSPNENYARELLELHTISPGNYTQRDVEEIARCFTGWTWWGAGSGWATGSFRFIIANHDDAEKTVLGHTIPAGGGLNDGLMVLRILAEHPATAEHISRKLCRWFLEDDPSPSVVRSVIDVYTNTGGDIKAVIRQVLRPNHLAAARPKFKRPFHLLASVFRALPHTMTTPLSLRYRLGLCGHRPYSWPAPNGYPEGESIWGTVLMPRWNMIAELVGGIIDGIDIDFAALFAGHTTPQQKVDRLNDALFAGEMPPADRAQLIAYISGPPGEVPIRTIDAVGLALSTPAFQYF
jgi:uncharacterized protein (DUF1800 family)